MGNEIVDIVWDFWNGFSCNSGIERAWSLDAYDLWDGVWGQRVMSAFSAKTVD